MEQFGDPFNNKHGFPVVTLKDVAKEPLSYGSVSSAVAYDGRTRYVRITDITDNGALGNDIKSASDIDEKYLLHDGDILFARTGATVGKTCRYKETYGRAIYAGFLIRLIPDKTKINPDYLYYFTKSDYYWQFVKSSQRVVAQPNINAQEYGELQILLPDMQYQKQFAAFVQQSDKSKFAALWSANKAMLSIKDLMAVLKYNKIPAVPSEIICCTASIAGIGTIYSRRQRDMFTIDKDKFHHAVWELIGRVISEQSKNGTNDPTKVTFNSGWFKDEEWYKRDVWDEAQGILQVDTWSEETIKTLDLTGRIIRCMDVPMESGKKQNLLDWRETDDNGGNSLKKRITADKELSDIAIYQIFRGDDESHAFQDAVKIWGAKYPFITFLFFLKDINHFAVVRPVAMKKRFERLGILSDCLNVCSWKNYQEFLEILKELKRLLKEEIDPATELIDAHSFLWATWLLEKTEIDPLSDQFEQIERDLSCKEIVGDVRKAVVKVRVNQSVFRDCLLEQGKKCAICGVDHPALLTASHIRPWSESNKSEKVDADNGLLLCPNHDQLFDGGWITFSDDGKIMISKQLSTSNQVLTNIRGDICIKLPEGSKKYMKYHREHIFKDRTPDGSASR